MTHKASSTELAKGKDTSAHHLSKKYMRRGAVVVFIFDQKHCRGARVVDLLVQEHRMGARVVYILDQERRMGARVVYLLDQEHRRGARVVDFLDQELRRPTMGLIQKINYICTHATPLIMQDIHPLRPFYL